MSESTVKKICLGVLIVFFLMWLFVSADKEDKAMSEKYQTGYDEGYAEGYADALIKYGIEE